MNPAGQENDDIFDENLDFDDEALDSEAWDEFDDEEDFSENIVPEASNTPQSSKKKSFFLKHFNLIVVSVAVLGGGGFLYSKFSKPMQNTIVDAQSTDSISTSENELQNSDMPPMPASLDVPEVANNTDAAQNSLEAQPAFEDANLTPMPNFNDEGAAESLEPIDIDMTLDSLDENISTKQDILPNEPLISNTVETNEVNDPITEQAVDLEDAVQEKVEDFSAPSTIADVENTPSLAKPQISDALTDNIIDDIVALEERLQQIEISTKSMSDQIDATNQTLQNLSSSIDTISSTLEKINTTEDSKPAIQSSAKISEKPVEQKNSKTKKVEPVKQSSKARPVVKKSWSLRSAQPGSAIIRDRSSGNIREIKIGDTVQGLGKITKISAENGLWVVQGTQGRVTQ